MAFGSKFVGIEIGANAVRGVVLRKTGNTYRVIAAEKIEPDPASGKILDFPEGAADANFSPEAAEILRRLGKGASRTAVAVSDVEILLRHLPIPRSAGENLQPLIRAVLAAPQEEEVTFTYRRLPKAAPAPDHDLVLVAASRGLKLRRLVGGLKQVAVKVSGLTPHSESLLFLARTAAADIPTGTPLVSLEGEEGVGPQAEESSEDPGGGGETGGETFVLLDEGGPLFAIAPDSDMRAVTFGLIEEGDLLFARRVALTSMTGEGGRPADGIGLIQEIAEEAIRTLDLAKGTLKRSDLVPGDVRIFGRRRVSQELATAMTRKMGVPVRIVPAEGWGSVTVQAGVVFDPGDYALALGLAIAAAEEEQLVVPPASARVERLGVHGRMRVVAAVVAAGFVFAPALRAYLYKVSQEENGRAAKDKLRSYVNVEAGITGRAVAYDKAAADYSDLVTGFLDDGGLQVLSSLFDFAPPEMKFTNVRISPAHSRDKWILPPAQHRVTLVGLIDPSETPTTSVLLQFVQKLETERLSADKPSLTAQGEMEIRGKRLDRFEISFLTHDPKGSPKKEGS